jgi:hypothetical protein
LPRRIGEYGGEIEIRRVALLDADTERSQGLPLEDKQKDPRYKWYRQQCQGRRFWELDGLDPRILRDRVDQAIEGLIDRDAWDRCMVTEQAEYKSLNTVFNALRDQAPVLFGLNS